MGGSDAKASDGQAEKKKADKASKAEAPAASEAAKATAAAKAPLGEIMGVGDPMWLQAWRRGAAPSANMEAKVTFAGDCLSIGADGDTVLCADARHPSAQR